MNDRGPDLVAWQWNSYPTTHANRTNLLVHLFTQPFFAFGFLMVIAAPLTPSMLSVVLRLIGGLSTMGLVTAIQGRFHRLERAAPVRFAGPVDAVGRLLLEQLITWPRFVLSGGVRRAWRAGT